MLEATHTLIGKGLSFKERTARDDNPARPNEQLLIVCPPASEHRLDFRLTWLRFLSGNVRCDCRFVDVRVLELRCVRVLRRKCSDARRHVSSFETPPQLEERTPLFPSLLLYSSMIGMAARPFAVRARLLTATNGTHRFQRTVCRAISVPWRTQRLRAVIHVATRMADAHAVHDACRYSTCTSRRQLGKWADDRKITLT